MEVRCEKIIAFPDRLAEACRTDKPALIQRLLNISYQSAKNYLNGRIPSAEMLILISERTNCSIDWLLTGRGKKFVAEGSNEDTPISSRQIESIARRVCVEVINEKLGDAEARLRVVQLHSSEVLSEKVLGETKVFAPERDSRRS